MYHCDFIPGANCRLPDYPVWVRIKKRTARKLARFAYRLQDWAYRVRNLADRIDPQMDGGEIWDY